MDVDFISAGLIGHARDIPAIGRKHASHIAVGPQNQDWVAIPPEGKRLRFNRRRSRSRGKLFYRLAQQAVAVGPASYDVIVGQTRGQARKAEPLSIGLPESST